MEAHLRDSDYIYIYTLMHELFLFNVTLEISIVEVINIIVAKIITTLDLLNNADYIQRSILI